MHAEHNPKCKDSLAWDPPDLERKQGFCGMETATYSNSKYICTHYKLYETNKIMSRRPEAARSNHILAKS
jgi:hypothetical protein